MNPRPIKNRICSPRIRDFFFKPRGISISAGQIEELKVDEVEAMRLCDIDDLNHEDAAAQVGISRRTLERLLRRGRYKVASALFKGHGIRISIPGYISFRERGNNK